MKDKIRVVIADDIKETRENIKTLLSFDNRIEVIGEANDGDETVQIARTYHPDIILMDVNMPGKDGIRATEEISIEMPDITIIIMSVQNESEYLKKAMTAGARDYITKPFSGDELISSIIDIYALEMQRKEKMSVATPKEEVKSKIISVFSTKGGVGKTTIATNLAVSIARQTKKRVALVDVDLLFGDVAIHLNMSIKSTIADVVKEIHLLDDELIEEYLITHFSGVRVLAAPAKPEYAEYITAAHIEKIIKALQQTYHYIVIDTGPNFDETTLTALDVSDMIIFVSTLDLPTIKNVKTGLEVMDSLRYSNNKVKIAVNKASEQYGIKFKDFEDTLNNEIWAYIPEDSYTVINATNKGFPFVITRPETKVARSIYDICSKITTDQKVESQSKSLFKKILGL